MISAHHINRADKMAHIDTEHPFKSVLRGTKEASYISRRDCFRFCLLLKDNILFCKSRILDGQRFLQTGEFDEDSLGVELGLNLFIWIHLNQGL